MVYILPSWVILVPILGIDSWISDEVRDFNLFYLNQDCYQIIKKKLSSSIPTAITPNFSLLKQLIRFSPVEFSGVCYML